MRRELSRQMVDQSMLPASSSSAIELARPWAHTNGRPRPPSSRTARATPLLNESLIAQVSLEDLARRVARQLFRPEPDLDRDLEGRQAVAHVGLEIPFG